MKVPVYDTPQVQPDTLPGVRQSNDFNTGTAALGEGVQRLGAGFHEQFARAVDAAATDGLNQLSSHALDLEHGTADGQAKGFFQLHGQDALAQSSPTLEALAKKQQEIAGKLSPDARRVFLERSQGLLLEHRRAIESYAANQSEALNQATAVAASDSAARTAALSYADDKLVTAQVGLARKALDTQLAGMPEEVKQAAYDGLKQKVAAARLQAAVDAKDVDFAKSFFAANRGAFGTQAPQFEHVVRTLVDGQLGQKNAQALIEAARRPNGSVDEDVVAKGFEGTPESARTPAFKEALDERMRMERAAWNGQKTGAFGDALSAYLQGGHSLAAVKPETRAWLTQNDPEGWVRLEQLDKGWRSGAAGGASGSPSQIAALNQVRYEMAQSPEKFAAMTPAELARQWAPQLSPEGFKEIGKEHAKLIADSQKPGKLAAPVYGSIVNAAAHAFGEVNPKTQKPTAPAAWSEEHHRLLDQVTNSLLEQDAAYRKAHGGQPMPPDQLEKAAQAQLVKGTVKGSGWFGTGFRATEETALEAQQKGDVLVDDSGNPIAGTTEAPNSPQTPAATASREVVSYRYNRARTMRIPVYSDGTQGAPESAQ